LRWYLPLRLILLKFQFAYRSSRVSWWPLGLRLWPLTCWDCGFETCRGHVCSYFVNVVCCTGTGLYDGPIPRLGDS